MQYEHFFPLLAVCLAPVLTWIAVQWPGIAVGAIGALMAWRWPVQMFLAVFVLVEEETEAGLSNAQAGLLLRVGSSALYKTNVGPVPVITIFLMVAATAALLRSRRIDRLTWFIGGGIAVYCFSIAALQGQGIGEGRFAARPFIDLALASVIGASIKPSDKAVLLKFIAGLFLVKAVQGVLAFATGQGVSGDSPIKLVFYDSTISTLAVTAAIAGWLTTREAADWRPIARRVLALTAIAVMLCALRRNAIAGGLVAVAAVGFIGREWKSLGRLCVAALLIVLGLAFFDQTLLGGLFDSFSSAWRSATGSSGAVDNSSVGHASDISLGFSYVRELGPSGAGINSPALPGFVVDHASALYVHNEFLQDWLRIGLIGALSVSVLVLLGLLRAVRMLQKNRTDVLDLFAACFLIAQPLTLWFFPHLSTLQRWPSMVGFFMGLLWASRTDSREVLGQGGGGATWT